MNKFKVGDVVSLTQGGPFMTVEDVLGDNVSVVWFGSKREFPSRNKFYHSILELCSNQRRQELAFEVGDKVSLNYYSPLMTVERIVENLVSVVWFNETTNHQWEGPFRDKFLGQVLVKVL